MRTLRANTTTSLVVIILAFNGIDGVSARSSWLVADEQTPTDTEPLKVLDVPFIPQSDALCGGAAAAMVLRYWGERGVYAEDFQQWVHVEANGITTDDLVEAVRSRGWSAVPFTAGDEEVRRQLSRGRPLVVLLEDRPGRYHYVVLVSRWGRFALLHDPARAPFLLVQQSELQRARAAAGNWALLILPPETPEQHQRETSAFAAPTTTTATIATCELLVTEAVRIANDGDLAGAETLLSAATRSCPKHAAAFRELAGVRFRQKRWSDAARLAETTVALDPADRHAWRVLASSRYLAGDAEDALEAWNRIGEPRIDLVRVDGLQRTRYAIVEELLDLSPGSLLTGKSLRRARRRLRSLPAVAASRISYRPFPDRSIQVEAAVMEKPVFYRRLVDVGASVPRTLVKRELTAEMAGATGNGELWSATWRWWENRPRASFGASMPGAMGMPGVWSLGFFWERQAFYLGPPPGQTDTETGIVREERIRALAGVHHWIAADYHVQLEIGLERFRGQDPIVSLGGAVESRNAGDRIAFRIGSSGWLPLGDGEYYATGDVRTSWRSSAKTRGPRLAARLGFVAATHNAPFSVWPVAGAGEAATELLRAHTTVESGVIGGEGFANSLMIAGLELNEWFLHLGSLQIGYGGFLDVAKTWIAVPRFPTVPAHVDIGVGLRLRLPHQPGLFHVDFAYGLEDGESALSAIWRLPWPGWR